ncbi:MAG: L-glutamate gamma-semialdehyde dehydrogenase [Candidatus Coatesbacteria bacterium]|nr:MAG: L-glutamate gamma-semialdehyde dehydrogenase [Candidatus Coatesbacteria bacterium]HDM59515.1 L-glutamate gamma-semialdehyde dehydrogenase [Bacillota bacterium]
MIADFKNEPYVDFSKPENRKKMEEAIAKRKSEAGKEYESVIGRERIRLDAKLKSYNPSHKDEVVGVFQKAGPDLADKAIKAADDAFASWKYTSADMRAEFAFKVADLMRKFRFDFDAAMVLEEGKNWLEADADTAEAIDFLEFYGREAIRYSKMNPVTPVPGEDNELRYIPLGVGVVISPWNFPNAIMTGMTSASWIFGNTVVLKPSSDAPLIAALYFELLQEVGLPPGVVNFVPGSGSTFGFELVKHPRCRFIAFTGSKEVGLKINEEAAKLAKGQKWIKRAILEMGGKDTIIVDENCDLDAAVDGVLASAFGFQGQKCSACSRVVLLESVHDEFIEKLIPKVEAVKVGDPVNPDNYMGPVINQAAEETTLRYIETAKKEGAKLLCGGEKAPGDGYFIKPTVFDNVKPDDTISQEEIFGPVLAVLTAKDFPEALKIANNTVYGLTGGVYSSSRANLERARREFHVGNLYFNRKCTGALVGGHPFGGFNMSGTDSKAGGQDYYLLFTQAKVISERIR